MNSKPGFVEGVGVALVLSGLGAFVFGLLHPFVVVGVLLRLLLSGIGFAYVVYLLWRARDRIGRLSVLTLWLLANVVIWVMYPPILLYLTLQMTLIWLIRAMYFYSGVLPSLLDLSLNAIALVLAIVAGLHTTSLFSGLWCFFLCQALFVFIPSNLQRRVSSAASSVAKDDRFERAHRAALAAVRKLSMI
jgi:hypothetical protein